MYQRDGRFGAMTAPSPFLPHTDCLLTGRPLTGDFHHGVQGSEEADGVIRLGRSAADHIVLMMVEKMPCSCR